MSDIKPGKLSQFRPATRNANKHTGRGLKLLADAMNEVGYVAPITVAADGEALDGSARLETAFEKFGDEAIVIRHDGTKPIVMVREDIPNAGTPAAKKIAYGANRIAQLDLEWEPLTLAADLEAGLDLGELFRPEEISAILEAAGTELLGNGKPDPGPQEDKAKELQAKWQTATGQVWQLGRHRLVCGDCTDRATVEAAGISVEMPLFTDPPYGINYDPSWLDGVYPHRQALSSRRTLDNDDGTLDLSFLWNHSRRMVWGFPYIYDKGATGWIVWDKQPGVDGRGIVTPIEMASTTMRKGFDMVRVMWGGYYRAASEDKQPHPTQKPKGVMEPFIESWTKPGETIADYFCGSGVVIIACENLNRQARCIEIDPGYCAVSIQRWVDLTGKEPVLIH